MIVCGPELSIGILAHNEQANIGKTLRSLFAQDIFQKFSTEVVIVANGCNDETVAVANRILANYCAVWSMRGSARVENLATAGKANAWNQFVHKLSSPNVSVLILMDADITFLNSNTISSMVRTLEADSQAVVCVDCPIKDLNTIANRTVFQRLLIAATPEIDADNVPLCGQLYCVRSAAARTIKVPVAIPGEDGFLRALLLTDGFTKPENRRRIVLDSSVAHSFVSVASLRELFKHEKWIVASSIVSMLLYERFWAEATPNRSAMTLMEDWQRQNPDWLPQYIQDQVQKRGWHLLPRAWWIRRWSRLIKLPLRHRLLRFHVAVIATMMDMFIFIAAIRDVRGGRSLRYWGRK